MKVSQFVFAPPVSSDSQEMRNIAQQWERFVSGQAADLSILPSTVRDAWIRSKEKGIDPALARAPHDELPPDPEMFHEEIRWISCAEPVLSFLRAIFTEPHQLLLLGDHQGRILQSHGGPKALVRAEEIRAIPGGRWGEDQVGCSVLGTSIYTNAPVQLRWQENYCVTWQDWINHSAPFHDPTTKEILGAVSISGYRELNHPQALELIVKAVGMIETGLREHAMKARVLLLEHFTRLVTRYPSEGLLAVDRHGCILDLNLSAEKQLSLPRAHILGRRIQALPAFQELLGQSLGTRLIDPQLAQEHLPGVTVFPVSADRTAGAAILLAQPSRPTAKKSPPQPWGTSYTFADLIGDSPRFRESRDFALTASQQDWPVLILGESGTGKELFAQAIHNASPRRSGPFVVFSCAGISDELIGAELFGYTEGTFTGALKGGKVGKLQLAHTGTLFLDDIDSMPPRMQASLLRVLEDHRVVPLGAYEPRSIDVRVIAATNADLEQAVREGRFRHDLYYRLSVFSLVLPSLRDRIEDIPLLTAHLLARLAPSMVVSDEALWLLASHTWPGNIRELRNVLVTALARAHNGKITAADLPPSFSRSLASSSNRAIAQALPPLKTTEREKIVQVLKQTASVQQAASLLGLHYSTLYRKLKKYGISLPPEQK